MAHDMGSACASPSVVLWSPRSPYVVAENHLCSLCKSLMSDWKFYPNFLTILLFLPQILMAYALLTLLITLSPPTPLYLPVTRWDLLCVCVLKTHCPEFTRLLCVYSIPQNTYSGIEMSGGTICWLSRHPTFSYCSVLCGTAIHNPSVPMTFYWNHVFQMCRPVLTLLAPH